MPRLMCRCLAGLLIAILCASRGTSAQAANQAQIQQAIGKGVAHIKLGLKDLVDGKKSLAYITLLKAGEPHDSPLMLQGAEYIQAKIKDGEYGNPPDQLYEAAVDIMFLADLDAVKYKPEIQIIANYLLKHQEARGSWSYPPPYTDPNAINGDISTTHYACLGLWGAARAGVAIDPQVWVRVLNWLSSVKNPDGGFCYKPGTKIGGDSQGGSSINMTVNSVGTMYIAMINLDPTRLPNYETGSKGDNSKPAGTAGSPKKQDALEAVNLDTQEAEAKAKLGAGTGTIPESAFATLSGAFQWANKRFDTQNKESGFKTYYYYSLERMGALSNVTKLNNRDWFNECADFLLAAQNGDGSWAMNTIGGTVNDTCFSVLFLTRSTGKILKRTTLEPPVGGGLLSGGRGLPDDLKELDASGNVKKKKEKSSLDDLLASLQNADTADIEEAQTELVQQIQLGDKKELIGKKDVLIKLMESKDPEVRRTAIWAIGRTGDLSLARFAILGLDDPNSAVMKESHLALCWTARKPKAFRLPEDPLEELAADAGPDQKSAAVDSWRRQALRLWGEWYLRNRPYAERGDEFETNLRNRLLELK